MESQKGTVRFMVSRVAFSFTLLVVLIPVIASPKTASSQDQTPVLGSDLVDQCKAYIRFTTSGSGDAFKAGECFGYINGFGDGTGSIAPLPPSVNWRGRGYCYTNASSVTLAKVYLAFMEKNPKYLDYDEGKTLLLALHDAYPCK
jgi:hypothetical protein